LCSTQKLILDYKQFKAAQLIQRNVRGWLVRFRNQKFIGAAIVIQKWWRRFMFESILVIMAEAKLQQAVLSHYNKCATLIQKVFRGWWSRKHVNDLTKLKSLQTSLTEYLITVLSVYLHEVKHKGQVPGLYYKNFPEKCIETIDQLLATLDYRIYNAFSCYKMQKKMAEVNVLRNTFKKSDLYTFVPFRGFDDRGVCEGRPSEQKVEESADLIRAFVCQKHDVDMKSKVTRKFSNAGEGKLINYLVFQKLYHITATFLKRIAHYMKRWHYADGNVILPKKIFRMTDIKALLDEVKNNLEDIFGQLEACKC
ncbi:hypothetical protein KR038_005967, partial [Drosophila bunnanda]